MAYEHMSWCQGDHDDYGGCRLARPVSEDLSITLAGVPCDYVRIELEGDVLCYASDVDLLVAALGELRPLLDASEADVDCDLHDHSDEDEDEDEEEDDEPCSRCGAYGVNLLRVHTELGGGEVIHEWRCRTCCEATGIAWDVP